MHQRRSNFNFVFIDVDCSGNSAANSNFGPNNRQLNQSRIHFRSSSNSSNGSNGGVDRGWDDEGIEQDHEDDLDSVDPRPLSPNFFENKFLTQSQSTIQGVMNKTVATTR